MSREISTSVSPRCSSSQLTGLVYRNISSFIHHKLKEEVKHDTQPLALTSLFDELMLGHSLHGQQLGVLPEGLTVRANIYMIFQNDICTNHEEGLQ